MKKLHAHHMEDEYVYDDDEDRREDDSYIYNRYYFDNGDLISE